MSRSLYGFLLLAPAGTPHDIVLRMNREMDKVPKDPDTAHKMNALGFFSDGADPPGAVAGAVRADYAKWGRIVKEIGIEPE